MLTKLARISSHHPVCLNSSKKFSEVPILILTKSLGFGGVERATATLVEELEKEGLKVQLGLLETEYSLPHEIKEPLRLPPSWMSVSSRLPYFVAHPLRVTLFAFIIQSYVLRYRPQIILTTCTHTHMATRFLIWRGAKWLGWVGSDLADGIERSTEIPLLRWVTRTFFTWVYKGPSRIAVPTIGLKDELVEKLSLNSQDFRVIPNPFRMWSGPLQKRQGPKLKIVSAGRLAKIKGFDILLRAMAPLDEVHLEILGDGPQRRDLEKLTATLEMESRVSFLGWVDEPEGHFAAADIVVIPSRREGFCYVLLEAMSLGCCVVVSDCPHGPKEIVGDSTSAVFFPSEDWLALSQILKRLIENPSERERLGKRAKTRAGVFELDKCIKNYKSFFFSS